MTNSSTYKQKFLGIVLGFFILLLAAYKKTYRHILEAKSQLAIVDEKLKNVDESYNEVYILKNEINSLDSAIGGQSNTPQNVQQMILDFISKSQYKVDISTIEDTHILSDNEFNIYTNSLELEGSYFDLIQLFYDIETNFNYSKVVSSKLYSQKNYRNNTKRLYLKLIFQNYEKNN